jgi:hypothetical protein
VKGAEPDRRRTPENFGQEGRGRLRIACMNDRVIQLNGHVALQGKRLLLVQDATDFPKSAR